jgi:hypothetical protein
MDGCLPAPLACVCWAMRSKALRDQMVGFAANGLLSTALFDVSIHPPPRRRRLRIDWTDASVLLLSLFPQPQLHLRRVHPTPLKSGGANSCCPQSPSQI